jgi:hypothetical protein
VTGSATNGKEQPGVMMSNKQQGENELSEWKQIETAPKDGTSVLICCMNAKKTESDLAHFFDGRWIASSLRCRLNMLDRKIDALEIGFYENPTHWMPLPEAPKK